MPPKPRPSRATDPAKKPSKVKTVIAKATAAVRADDDMKAVFDEFLALGPAAIEKCTPQEARAQPTPTDAVMSLLRKQGRDTSPEALVPGVTAVDRIIPGADGTELRARIYTPNGDGVFPVAVYFHGGGWVIADLDVYDGGARGIARQARAIVVSVDYRQAPEHRFPAAWDDALAAYRWVALHCAEFRGDAARLAIAGESAGGCLAIATAVAARDLSLPPPRHVVSVYPVAQTGSMSTPSYIENALAMPLNRAMMSWFFEHVLRSEADKADTRIDIVNAELRGLPAVTIVNAMLDPLRSDGAMLEEALQAADVPVLRKDFHGVSHEFFGAAAVLHKAREAQRLVGERLRHAFI
jgi:acetyl esterase/lipase